MTHLFKRLVPFHSLFVISPKAKRSMNMGGQYRSSFHSKNFLGLIRSYTYFKYYRPISLHNALATFKNASCSIRCVYCFAFLIFLDDAELI